MNDPNRKVVIQLSSWFHRSDSKMKGDLKSEGIYRTFVTKITPTQFLPVIMDIPEKVWRMFGEQLTPTTKENRF